MATVAQLEAELAAAYATRKAIIESRAQQLTYPDHSGTHLSLRQLTDVIRDLELRIAEMNGGTRFRRIRTRSPTR